VKNELEGKMMIWIIEKGLNQLLFI